MGGHHRTIYRMDKSIINYYANRGHNPHCEVCNFELMEGDVVVSKGSGGRKDLYCPFCAIEKNIELWRSIAEKLGTWQDWVTDAYARGIEPAVFLWQIR